MWRNHHTSLVVYSPFGSILKHLILKKKKFDDDDGHLYAPGTGNKWFFCLITSTILLINAIDVSTLTGERRGKESRRFFTVYKPFAILGVCATRWPTYPGSRCVISPYHLVDILINACLTKTYWFATVNLNSCIHWTSFVCQLVG